MGEVWRFLTLTGLRNAEFCWLLKDDVTLDASGQPQSIRIRRKVCPLTGRSWRPKHNIERIVPLHGDAKQIITKRLMLRTTPWLFEAPNAVGPQTGKWTSSRLQSVLKKLLASRGISHGSPHTFRHTSATIYANDIRMPLAHLQRFLGHKDVKTTMQYVHPTVEDVAESVSMVDFTKMMKAP